MMSGLLAAVVGVLSLNAMPFTAANG